MSIRISATHNAHDPSQPHRVIVTSPEFATREEAEAWAALFPKSAGFSVSNLASYPLPEGGWRLVFGARSHTALRPTKGNDRNETGIKRYHAIMKKAQAAGLTVDWETTVLGQTGPYIYQTREAFESAIA